MAAADPSAPFVAAMRERFPGVDVREAPAERMPFADDGFDVTLAQLVVHFMPDPVAGIREMARVTRPGGVVAACVWDHGGQRGPLRDFWAAARTVVPDVDDESELPGTHEGHLEELFAAAGLLGIESAALTVTLRFASFEAWWEPFTRGVGPAGAFVHGLDPAARGGARGRVPPAAPRRRAVHARRRGLGGARPGVAGERRRPGGDGGRRRMEGSSARRPLDVRGVEARHRDGRGIRGRGRAAVRRRAAGRRAAGEPSAGQSPWAPRPGRASPEESVPGVVSGAVVTPSSPVVGAVVAAGVSEGLGSAANATAEPPTTSSPIASSAMAIERFAPLKAPPDGGWVVGVGSMSVSDCGLTRSRRPARPVTPSRRRWLRVG